jgi:transcriptional regulator with XRE-family HTH domain
MNAPTTQPPPDELAAKIARLVQERGWNQEEFAKMARVNRHTARQILHGGDRRLRNSTVAGCAKALGLSVHELHTLPVEKLLARMAQAAAGAGGPRRVLDQASHPELRAWLERNGERARRLAREDLDELLAMQGDGGPFAVFGVEGVVQRLERRRRLVQQVGVIANTEYLELLEQLVGLLYDKVRPAGE